MRGPASNATSEISDRIMYLMIAALGLLLYLPTVRYQFTYFDDYALIVKQASYISNVRNVGTVFGSDVFRAGTVAYRPGLIVSFMADALIGGIGPRVYHLSNVLIHLCTTVLLFALLRMIGAGRLRAGLITVFFLWHPLNAQAVAWIPGRNDSVMGLWMVAALIGLVRYKDGGGTAWLALHLVAWGCALFTKEAAAVFPLAGVVYAWWHWRQPDRRRVVLLVWWAAVGLLWYLMRNRALVMNPDAPQMLFNTVPENILGFAGYVGKVLFPIRMTVLPVPRGADLIPGIAAVTICASVVAACGVRNIRLFTTGIGLAACFMLPHLMRGTPYPNFLEHRMYVPLLGVAVMLSQLDAQRLVDRYRPVAVLGGLIVIGLFGFRTSTRLPVFTDSYSLLYEAIETAPGIVLPYQYLSAVYIDHAQYDIAEVYLDQAQRMEPGNKDVYQNLGIVYESTGRGELAQQAFRHGLALEPRATQLRYNLGLFYQQAGRLPAAAREYRLALMCRPDHAPSLLNLGMVYHQRMQLDSAELCYQRALQSDPELAEANFNLGVIWQQRGDPVRAGRFYDRAVKEKPWLREQIKR